MVIDPASQAMYDEDASAAFLGIELVEASPDRAVVTMPVRAEMCNGLGILHGGMTFLLADSAMAFASNAGPVSAVASSAEIDWLAKVVAGQVLRATATKAWSGGRSTLWNIEVTADDGTTVALVRGRTRQVKSTTG
jgi:acyl-CoA thioesterase